MVDFSGFSDPQVQMLLTMGASLLESSAGGRPLSTGRNTLGRAVGRAGMAGLGAYNQSKSMGLRNKLSELQYANALRREKARGNLSKMLQPQPAGPALGMQMMGAGMGANPTVPPDMKRLGQNPEFMQNVMDLDPRAAIGLLTRQQNPLSITSYKDAKGTHFIDARTRQEISFQPHTGGRLTAAQIANNAETVEARKWLERMSPEEIFEATKPNMRGGLVNPSFNPHIARIARQAQQKMVGGDPDHAKWVRRVVGEPPSPEPPIDASPGPEPKKDGSFWDFLPWVGNDNPDATGASSGDAGDAPAGAGRTPLVKPRIPNSLDTAAIRSRLPEPAPRRPTAGRSRPPSRRGGVRGQVTNPRPLPDNPNKLVVGEYYETRQGVAQWDGREWRTWEDH